MAKDQTVTETEQDQRSAEYWQGYADALAELYPTHKMNLLQGISLGKDKAMKYGATVPPYADQGTEVPTTPASVPTTTTAAAPAPATTPTPAPTSNGADTTTDTPGNTPNRPAR
jgi:hypothetical protein